MAANPVLAPPVEEGESVARGGRSAWQCTKFKSKLNNLMRRGTYMHGGLVVL